MINSLETLWKTHSAEQWVEWLISPYPEGEFPNIDWIISVFSGGGKDDGKPDLVINSLTHIMVALKDPLRN